MMEILKGQKILDLLVISHTAFPRGFSGKNFVIRPFLLWCLSVLLFTHKIQYLYY